MLGTAFNKPSSDGSSSFAGISNKKVRSIRSKPQGQAVELGRGLSWLVWHEQDDLAQFGPRMGAGHRVRYLCYWNGLLGWEVDEALSVEVYHALHEAWKCCVSKRWTE